MGNLLSRTIASVAGGKAVADHPIFHGLDPWTTYSPGQPREDAVISQREAAAHLDVYGGRKYAIDWVMDCVRLYADTASDAEWHLEKRDGTLLVKEKTDGTPAKAQVGPKDLYALLEKPNQFMDYAELIELTITDLLLVGNAYWFKQATGEDGKPLSLWRVAPQYMKIVPGPRGPKRYEYTPPGAKNPIKMKLEEVIHYRLPNPHSMYYGLGLVQGGGRVLDTEIALVETQASYFENKAEPSVIFQSDRRVPRDVFNKLRAQLRAKTAGPRNSGEMLLLEAGLKAETLTPSAKEALFDTLSRMSRDRIFAMFRCSPMLFGIMDETSGSTKISDFRREFDTKTMRPFLNKLQKRITAGLCDPWDVDFKIDYNYIIPQEEVIKQGGELAAIPGVKVREVRSFLFRGGVIEEISTGDQELDEMVMNEPQEEMDENGQGGAPDRNLPGEAGRPPERGTQAFRPRGAQGATSKTRRPRGTSVKSVASWDEIEARLAEAEGKAIRLEEPEPFKMPAKKRPKDALAVDRNSAVDYVATQTERKITNAVHVLERTLMDNTEGTKALDRAAERRIRNSTGWSVFAGMLEDALFDGTRDALATAVTHQASLGRNAEIDVDAVARDLVLRPEGVEGITSNLKSEMLKIVSDAIDAGKEKPEVDRLIREKVQTWRDAHSETIALTEATHAYNEGTLVVAEASGAKVLVEDGHDHDAECAAADGQVWDIGRARANRLEHPRCRRAFTIIDDA